MKGTAFKLGAPLCATLMAMAAVAYGVTAPSSTLLGPATCRIRPGRRVSLTFDDGPSADTARILDILKRERVHATFFLLGAAVERYPGLARRIAAEGHEIGNHTYDHPMLPFMRAADIAAQIDRAQAAIEKATGRRPAVFRPPFGARWFPLARVLRERGLVMVMWSNFPREGASPAGDITARALARLSDGDIILLHDGRQAFPAGRDLRPTTVAALPAIIAGVRRAGLDFAPLESGTGAEGVIAAK